MIIYFILVNVKWGKEKFEGIEVDTSEPPEVFKAQLFALSGVPPERQKVMAKGTSLKVMTKSDLSSSKNSRDNKLMDHLLDI